MVGLAEATADDPRAAGLGRAPLLTSAAWPVWAPERRLRRLKAARWTVTERAETLARQLPETPVGRQLGWWLALLARGGEGATVEDWARFAPPLIDRFPPERTAAALSEVALRDAERLGEITEQTVEAASKVEITVAIRAGKERRWTLRVAVASEPPHPMTTFQLERRHEFQLGFREAGPADALLLADLESRCPIVMGETSIHFERGERYWDPLRLMEDASVGLASVDGVPAAVSCGAERMVRIGGTLKKMVTVSHLRVLPEHQRKGLWGAANKVLDKYWDHVDGSNAYISVDNLAMQHGFRETPNKWPQIVQRALLDCAALAGPPIGRPATPADAEALARRLNAFHGDEEMFVPYTAQSLAMRVERAPDLYGWDRLRMTEQALVGVWPADAAMRLVTESPSGRSVSLAAVTLDYAFEPGGEAEFAALLRAWCAELARAGMDTLVVYTSPVSPGTGLLTRLARGVEGYFMWTPGIAVPEGASRRGLYTDAIYF